MADLLWIEERKDPAIRDELDRRHPERTKLRPTDVAGLQQAFAVLEELWAPTIERARQLRPQMLHERVNGEYSFVETLRHLLFAWDAWLSRAVLRTDGLHEWGIPPDLPADAPNPVMWSPDAGWTSTDAAPDLDSVLDVRSERFARVRDYLSSATAGDVTANVAGPPWDPQSEVQLLVCFRVVLNDEWWHVQYATRDLAVFEQSA